MRKKAPEGKINTPKPKHDEEQQGNQKDTQETANQRDIVFDIHTAFGRLILIGLFISAQINHLRQLAGSHFQQALGPLIQTDE